MIETKGKTRMPSDREDKTLRLFLLGEVPETEREEIELAALSDPQLRERIEALEEELILDYVQESLPAGERSGFEAAYGQSAARRQRVEQTRALVMAIGQTRRDPASPSAAPSGGEASLGRGWLGFFSRFHFAFAGGAVAVLFGLTIWVRQQPNAPRTRSFEIVEPAVQLVAVVRLEPGLTRGSTGVSGAAAQPAILSLPGEAGVVRMELRAVQPTKSDAALLVAVRRVESPTEDWKGEAHRISERMVTVEIPARVLIRGDYVLRLIVGGLPAATYQFRVD